MEYMTIGELLDQWEIHKEFLHPKASEGVREEITIDDIIPAGI